MRFDITLSLQGIFGRQLFTVKKSLEVACGKKFSPNNLAKEQSNGKVWMMVSAIIPCIRFFFLLKIFDLILARVTFGCRREVAFSWHL